MKQTDIGFESFEENFYADPNTMLILPNEQKDKPLKLVYEDGVKVVENDDGTITFIRKLKSLEAEQILKCIFGTTNVGILDCSDMTDEEIEKLVDKWNSIPEEYLIPINHKEV